MVTVIIALLLLLFIYTSISKLAEGKLFISEIKQSPFLSPFANALYWLVPLIEIIVSMMLILKSWRMIGLISATGLLTAFTFYLITISNSEYYLPCGCGGILENLPIESHIAINIFYIIISLIGQYLVIKLRHLKNTMNESSKSIESLKNEFL